MSEVDEHTAPSMRRTMETLTGAVQCLHKALDSNTLAVQQLGETLVDLRATQIRHDARIRALEADSEQCRAARAASEEPTAPGLRRPGSSAARPTRAPRSRDMDPHVDDESEPDAP